MITTFNDTYIMKNLIGEGGMSSVYLAEHKRLHTMWAVKIVQKNQKAQFDFLAESNILKHLQHPALPRIVDIFEDSEKIYLVEDFVEGVSLQDLLQREKNVSEEQGLQWFRDLCEVLRYLHSQQPNPIIYRDLKPSNIMIQPDGVLKLIDFGIAREYKQESSADTTYIGTRGYAAPEQFGTAQTDRRTDIYSLGVTMYHVLTGKSPYDPPYQFVPVRQLVPSLSPGIEVILNRCTQPEPANRYQTVEELLDDLDHMYQYDDAWRKYRNTKRLRVGVIVGMLILSVGLMVGGRMLMSQEKETTYTTLLSQASEQYRSDFEGALALLEEARALYPDRIEADRQETYALYLNGRWQECVDHGLATEEQFGRDTQTTLVVASALFELGDYESAANLFYEGSQETELSVDEMRDYAVCLGRMGKIEEAQAALEQLEGTGARPDVTTYVRGELYYVQGDYVSAETAFTEVLSETDSDQMLRRGYLALGELYRDCMALVRTNNSPILSPAAKSVEVLSKAVTENALRNDPTLWEMLGMAYFEAYHTENDAPKGYMIESAACFNRVIDLGMTKDYLYTNLYTIHYELGDYKKAEQALVDYEEVFPNDYMPHALKGILRITIENQKPQEERDFSAALEEYELAGSMLRESDDTTYYQQLSSLIENLRNNGWL